MRFLPVFLLALIVCMYAHPARAFEQGTPSVAGHVNVRDYTNPTPGYAQGKISRYERQEIVLKHEGEPSSPCAENFDEVMNHLEMLMAGKVAENNVIAKAQRAY